MTDHPDPRGSGGPSDSSPDPDMTSDQLDELVGRLRDVPAPATSVRAAHIAAALAAFDDLPALGAEDTTDTPTTAPLAPVVSLDPRRQRRRRAAQRWAAAAGLVLVVGLGIGLATQQRGSSDDMATSASGSDASSDQQLSTERTADAVAPEAATASPGSQDVPPNPAILQLGDVADVSALRSALDAARGAHTVTTIADATIDMAPADDGRAAGGSASTGSAEAAKAPAPVDASCLDSLPPGSLVVAEATVAGRPVVIVETTTGSEGPTTAATVVDLIDCGTRPL
ncbi:MAG TPA: hypothetical protein PLS46_03290 [Microthrixaceae bacterium]|jgi:hypothetical protein|nr:hypothetical protein [Microthrixaceae bacterium]